MKVNKDQYQFLKDLTPQQFSTIAKGIRTVDKKNSTLGNAVKDFDIIRELGKGSYGTVYLVKPRAPDLSKTASKTIHLGSTQNFNKVDPRSVDHPNYQFGSTKQSTTDLQLLQTHVLSQGSGEPSRQAVYVLKKIPMADKKYKQQMSAVREAEIMAELDEEHGGHPNLIKYYTSFFENNSLYILMEYATKGDLYRILREQRHRKKYISERDMWDYANQICKAVAFMHSHNFMHRDIKCLNIFISDNKTIKLGDLGVSKFQRIGLLIQGSRVGTPLYLAPEIVKAQAYDNKIDLWAIGCALYHLACLEPPFQADNLVTLGNMIANKRHKQIPHVYSSKFRTFVDTLLSKHAKDRPTAEEALKQIPSFIRNQSALRRHEVQKTQPSLSQADQVTEPIKTLPTQRNPSKLSRQPSRGESIQKLRPSQINFLEGGPTDRPNILSSQPSSSKFLNPQASAERLTTEASRRYHNNYSRVRNYQRHEGKKQRLRDSITAKDCRLNSKEVSVDIQTFYNERKKGERQSLLQQSSKKRLASQLNFYKLEEEDNKRNSKQLMKIESEVSSIMQVEEKSAPIKAQNAGFNKLTGRHGSQAPLKQENSQTQRAVLQDEPRPKAAEPVTDRREKSREYTLSTQSVNRVQLESSRVFMKPRPKVTAIQSPTSSQSKSQIQFYPTQHKKSEDLGQHVYQASGQFKIGKPVRPSSAVPVSATNNYYLKKQLNIDSSKGIAIHNASPQIVPSRQLSKRGRPTEPLVHQKGSGPMKAIHFNNEDIVQEEKISPEFRSREGSSSNIFSSQRVRIRQQEVAISQGELINLSEEALSQINPMSFDYRRDANNGSMEGHRNEHSKSQAKSATNLKLFSRAQRLQAKAQTSQRSTFLKKYKEKQTRPQSSVLNKIVGAEALSTTNRGYSKMTSQAHLTNLNNESAENLRIDSKNSIDLDSQGDGGFIPAKKLERNFFQCEQMVLIEKQRLEGMTKGKQKGSLQRPMSSQPRQARQLKAKPNEQPGRAIASNSSLANQSYKMQFGPQGSINTNSVTIEGRAVPSKGLMDPANEWANQIISCLTQGDRSIDNTLQANAAQAQEVKQITSREAGLRHGGPFGKNDTNPLSSDQDHRETEFINNPRPLLSTTHQHQSGFRDLQSPDVIYSAGGALKIAGMFSQEGSLENTHEGGIVRRLKEKMRITKPRPKNKLEDWVVKVDRTSKVMRLSSGVQPALSRKITVNDLKR